MGGTKSSWRWGEALAKSMDQLILCKAYHAACCALEVQQPPAPPHWPLAIPSPPLYSPASQA